MVFYCCILLYATFIDSCLYVKILAKLCNNNAYYIVYCILYVYEEDNTKLKNLCLILLSLFRQYA